jgi:transposase InsO family protein
MESFFGSFKSEMVHFEHFHTKAEALAHIIDYITFYNRDRRHSSLGYYSPIEYEKLAA